MRTAETLPETRAWLAQAPVVLAAVATVLMLESVRIFVAYLVFVVDQANRGTLGGAAIGTFAAVGFGGIVARIGRSNAILATTGGLALARLVMQFWQQPEPRIVLGAATIVFWGWLVIAMLRWHRSAVALGIPIGLALDLSIRVATGTVDLPWMPGVFEHVTAVVLIGAMVGTAFAAVGVQPPQATDDGRATLSLLALGPGLAVYHLMTGNLSYAHVELETSLTAGAALLSLGMVLGLAGVAIEPMIASRRQQFSGPVFLALFVLALVVVVVFVALPQVLSPLSLVIATAASVVMLSLALQGSGEDRSGGSGAIAGLVTVGLLIHAVLLFTYYTFTGSQQIALAAWAFFLVFTMLGGRERASIAVDASRRAGISLVGGVAVIAMLAVGWQWLRYDEPDAGTPLSAEFTAMTYNIQSGFAVDNVWSLEQTARTIEAANPDIVVLQEVGRGWLVTTNMDQIEWLSQRLNMNYAFGSNSHDGLWGNAILSRAPILTVERHAFDTTQNLDRAVLMAEIATDTGSLWVLGTHFDNPTGAGNVRLEQSSQLVEAWEGRSPALLLGDLNATPDTDVLAFLDAAGLADPGLDLLGETTTSQDHLRIDYILTTSGLTTRSMEVPQTWTSDHLPVVARVRID